MLQVLLGDKYGPIKVPSQLLSEEFEALKAVAADNDLDKGELLSKSYIKDDNIVPPGFQLQVRFVLAT